MGENKKDAGRVSNVSKQPLWVLWDEGESDDKKIWKAKALVPGRKSPKGLDIDGVKAFNTGVKTTNDFRRAGHDAWWWLNMGARVLVGETPQKDGRLMITIISAQGSLSGVSNAEVDGWGVQKDSSQDVSWGEPADAG